MNQFYRKQIYLIQLLMRCCIWYGFFILFDYQKCLKTGEFHPIVALLVFPGMVLLWVLLGFIKNIKLKLVILIVLPVLLLGFTKIPWYFLLVETMLWLMQLYEKEEQAQKFGVPFERWMYNLPGMLLMLLILILHNCWSKTENPYPTYSPAYAGRFLLVAWIVYLSLYMINNYMKNFYEHFRHRKSAIPKEMFQRAKRSNYAMMVILVICGIGAMALTTLIPMGFYEAVIEFLKRILVGIFKLIIPEIQELELLAPKVEFVGSGGSLNMGVFGISGAGGGGLNIPPEAMGAILGALAVFAIYKIYKNFLVRYQVETDTAEFISVREEIEEGYESERGRLFARIYGNSNREKIRKMYYQTVIKRFQKQTKERQNKVSDRHTPKDLSRLLSTTPKEKEIMDEMTVYYEKARFGREESTNEEVEKVKNLM